ncbi:MAG: hypothetical protein O7D86_06275 [Proteobacteria bacterium]|nr:hypothetical protein [Pseudomonadota bacterium]
MNQRKRSLVIQEYILGQIIQYATDIVIQVGTEFKISRQATHGHVKKSVDEGRLLAHGNTRYRYYTLSDEASGERLSRLLNLDGLYDWSNQNMSADVLILRVLEDANLDDVIRVSRYFGIDRIKLIAKKVDPASIAVSILKRMIPNIEKGFEEARRAA